MPKRPRLAVILLNWRDEAQTMRRAYAVSRWASLEPLLIIIDNQSSASSRSALESGTAGKIIFSASNRGYSGGNNLGIQWALGQNADFVMLLNTDACIAESGVLALIGRLEEHSDISMVGPVLRTKGDGDTCFVGGRDIARYGSTRIAVDAEDIKSLTGYPLCEVAYVPGTVLLARRSVFEQVGMFDERFFFSGEVADLCRRSRDKGGRICVDLEVQVEHDTRHTSRELRETLYVYYSLRNRFLFVRKHYSSTRMWHFARWTLIGGWELAKSLTLGRVHKAHALWLAIQHGLGSTFGNQNARFKVRIAVHDAK